jgi:hypothetical protein
MKQVVSDRFRAFGEEAPLAVAPPDPDPRSPSRKLDMRKTSFSLFATILLAASSAWSQVNACDLNKDNKVDNADFQAAINMSLGIVSPCTANIAGVGVCDVLVVQRVANAISTGNCVTSTGLHMVELNWTASAGATSYQIFRGSSAGNYGTTPIGTSTTTNYKDFTVVSGSLYAYAVKAVNSSGAVSDFSTPATASIPTP